MTSRTSGASGTSNDGHTDGDRDAAARGLVFQRNKADARELLRHLMICDDHFTPKLSSRVDLNAFADRLLTRAHRFEAWHVAAAGEHEGSRILVGLVAMYCNAQDRIEAFITSVSVEPDHRGQGIAGTLVSRALDFAAEQEFQRAALEVDATATFARRLYTRMGFLQTGAQDNTLTLKRAVGTRDEDVRD